MANNLKKLIDIDLLAYFKSKLDLLFANKVDKETGKGLSSNDYTSAEKTKLSGVATGAQVNVLEGIQVAGSSITPTNKIANIPAASTSAAGVMSSDDKSKLNGIASGAQVNVVTDASSTGSGASQTMTVSKGSTTFTTYTKAALDTSLGAKANASSVYTKTEIDQKLTGAMNYKGTKETVAALPSTGNTQGDVWHVNADGGEYAWNGTAWEELGAAVDLSGYVEDDDLGFATTAEIDAIFE